MSRATLIAVARRVYYTTSNGRLATCDKDPANGMELGYGACPFTASLRAHYASVAPHGYIAGTGGYFLICYCQSWEEGVTSYVATVEAAGGVVDVSRPSSGAGEPPVIYHVSISESGDNPLLVSNITVNVYNTQTRAICVTELDATCIT